MAMACNAALAHSPKDGDGKISSLLSRQVTEDNAASPTVRMVSTDYASARPYNMLLPTTILFIIVLSRSVTPWMPMHRKLLCGANQRTGRRQCDNFVPADYAGRVNNVVYHDAPQVWLAIACSR